MTGLFAYVYIGLGTREYGADEFSGVAQLWTIWFFGASVLTFPLQHWVIQRLRTDGHGGAVRAVLPSLTAITLGIGSVVALVSLALDDDLFGDDALVYPLVAALVVVGSAAMGVLRGGLAGRSRFVATGTAIGTENGARAALGALFIALGASVGTYGAAIALGFLTLFIWPSALRFDGPSTGHVSPFAFLGNIAGGTVIAQSILTGGPVVVSLAGGTRDEVTSLFAALALFRAPYIIAIGLSIRVTAALTDLAVAGRSAVLDRVRRRTMAAAFGLMALGGAGAWLLGRDVLRLIFGDEIDLTRLECAGLAVGSVAALATLALTLVQMTGTTGRRVLQAWVIALVVGAVSMVAVPLDPLPRVVVAFLASELTAFAFMAVLDGSGDRR